MRKRITPDTARAWVDVDLDAVVRNARSFIAATGVPLLPMLKADGYGLGALMVARALAEVEPWGYGVATVDEARALHVNGIVRPVVIFSPLVYETPCSIDSLRSMPVLKALSPAPVSTMQRTASW